MKRIFFIIIFATLCFACSEDDPQELFIKTTEISLYPEDMIQIDAVSDFDITYHSTNTYVANVSETGLVSGNKVGEAIVEVASHDLVINVAVEIKGRYNLYPDPITDWSMTHLDLIEKEGEPDYSYGISVIEYHDYSSQAPRVVYLFNTNDTLMCVMVEVDRVYSNDLLLYMDERFVFDSEDGDIAIYRNAQTIEEASLIIGMLDSDNEYLMVLYIENTEFQAKSNPVVSLDSKNIRKYLEAIE